MTEDDDFVQSFLVLDKPQKLRLVSTGNIANTEFEALFWANLQSVGEAFEECRFIEPGKDALVIHQ